MNVLMSPVLWVFLAILYIFKGKAKAEGTDLSVFDTPVIDPSTGSTTQTTTNGTVIKGATINTVQAKSKASQLVELFDAFFSSESDILAVFKGLNTKDFMLIYDQFGFNHVRSYLGNEALGSNGIDLIEWLSKEVTSDASKNALKKQFPTIF
jgi:hypothetical protein